MFEIWSGPPKQVAAYSVWSKFEEERSTDWSQKPKTLIHFLPMVATPCNPQLKELQTFFPFFRLLGEGYPLLG